MAQEIQPNRSIGGQPSRFIVGFAQVVLIVMLPVLVAMRWTSFALADFVVVSLLAGIHPKLLRDFLSALPRLHFPRRPEDDDGQLGGDQ